MTEANNVEAPKTEKPVLIKDQIKQLQELTNGLAAFTQREIEGVKSGLGQMVEFCQALVQALEGCDLGVGNIGSLPFTEKTVQDRIAANRQKREQERAERDAKMVASLVEAGVLVAVDVVTEKSILIGREFDKEGNLLGGGRAQIPFAQFTEDIKPQMLGQGVGFVVEATGGKFEVVEIYEQATPLPPKVTEPPADAVVDAVPATPEK